MFANVANMKNLFFENPNDANIKEIGEIFYLRDAIIPIDTSDIKDVLEGADNAIVLHGKATGYNRCADAIEDATDANDGVAFEKNLKELIVYAK